MKGNTMGDDPVIDCIDLLDGEWLLIWGECIGADWVTRRQAVTAAQGEQIRALLDRHHAEEQQLLRGILGWKTEEVSPPDAITKALEG